MGKAHTHAYTDLSIFFEPEIEIVKHTLCGTEESVFGTARKWGWQNGSTNWEEVIENEDIDVVDISAPSKIHADIAISAAKRGKHIFCEKPLALNLSDAKKMLETVKKADIVHMIGFNYRRVPALALAKQLIEEGELGDIYHFRGIYQQDWLIDPNYPLAWRLREKDAGYGSHGDLGAHVIDLARFLVGEIEEVCCMQETFIKERPIPKVEDGLVAIPGDKMAQVNVDDASAFLFRFKDKNTMGYFEVTRYGNGHKNQNRIEINGSKGSIIFDMERMNELEFYSSADSGNANGFRRIVVGEGTHPYMANWWPAGHIIGYGDTFVNQAYDFICAIRDNTGAVPDFEDGYVCQKVLDAAQRSAEEKKWMKVG